jgi:uncharacterized membrane protein YphA (DoxX/SURF4 family)
MATDRHGTGLLVLRLFLGAFFISIGMSKYRWFLDTSFLARQLAGWQQNAAPGSISAHYLQAAIPYTFVFARLVPLGELSTGVALLTGFWTPVFAAIGFFMALNFHTASGVLFSTGFFTNGYGLPVLGGTLALIVGGVRLRWSVV